MTLTQSFKCFPNLCKLSFLPHITRLTDTNMWSTYHCDYYPHKSTGILCYDPIFFLPDKTQKSFQHAQVHLPIKCNAILIQQNSHGTMRVWYMIHDRDKNRSTKTAKTPAFFIITVNKIIKPDFPSDLEIVTTYRLGVDTSRIIGQDCSVSIATCKCSLTV